MTSVNKSPVKAKVERNLCSSFLYIIKRFMQITEKRVIEIIFVQ